MTYTNRGQYAKGLTEMCNWSQTTYLRGQYKFHNSYVDELCQRLVSSALINSVFASVEKDRQDEHNHLHLLFSSDHSINRYELSKITGFNSLGIGNVDNVKNKIGVTKYLTKHIGKNFSYHNLYV